MLVRPPHKPEGCLRQAPRVTFIEFPLIFPLFRIRRLFGALRHLRLAFELPKHPSFLLILFQLAPFVKFLSFSLQFVPARTLVSICHAIEHQDLSKSVLHLFMEATAHSKLAKFQHFKEFRPVHMQDPLRP